MVRSAVMKHLVIILALAGLALGSQPRPLAFEVVSIKPAVAGGNISGCRGIDSKLRPNDVRANVPLGNCIYSQTILSQLINQSYDLQAIGAIRGIPEWDRATRYRVEAKAENPASATEKQLFEMLQTMLADARDALAALNTRDPSVAGLVDRLGTLRYAEGVLVGFLEALTLTDPELARTATPAIEEFVSEAIAARLMLD